MKAEIFQQLVFHGPDRISRRSKKKIKRDFLRLLAAATDAAMRKRGLRAPPRSVIWRQARKLKVLVACVPPKPMTDEELAAARAVAAISRFGLAGVSR